MSRKFKEFILCLAMLLLLIGLHLDTAKAQQNLISSTQKTDWTSANFNGIAIIPSATSGVTGQTSTWANITNVTDANVGNYGRLSLYARTTAGILCVGAEEYPGEGTLKFENGHTYAVGNYIGFELSGHPNTTYKIETSKDGTNYTEVTSLTQTTISGSRIEIGGIAVDDYTSFRLVVTLIPPCNTTYNGLNYDVYKIVKKAPIYFTVSTCNQTTDLILPNYDMSVNPATATQVTDANLSNKYDLISVLGALLGPSKLSVSNTNNALFAKGNFLGFKVGNSSGLLGLASLNLLSNIQITTYLDNHVQESVSGANVLLGVGLISGSSNYEIGLILTKPANKIEITYSSTLNEIYIYNAVYKCFSESPGIVCNTKSYLTAPAHPVIVDKNISGIVSLGLLGDNIDGLDSIIDANTNNYATINQSLTGALSGFQVSVKNVLDSFPGGYYAGFEIGEAGLLDLDVLSGSLQVTTYLKGASQETVSGSSTSLLSLGTSILSGADGRKIIGFKTANDKPFDEIRLSTNVAINANVLKKLRIYGAIVQCFQSGPPLTCNEMTTITAPLHPVFVDGKHTGSSELIDIGGSTSNAENVIDNDPLSFASIDMTASLLGDITFAVSNAVDTYNTQAGSKTYVAFDISRTGNLLDVDVLNAISLRLIKPDGQLSLAVSPKLLAGVGVLTNEQHQKVGIVASEPFIGVQLVIDNTLGVSLGTLKIHGLSMQKLCDVPVDCGQSIVLTNGTHPVIIDNTTTGLLNLSLLGSNVGNVWNVVDDDLNNYAEITQTAAAFSATSLSVKNPVGIYPAGTIAGFTIEKSASIAELNLLNGIKIKTYRNGLPIDSATSGSLLDLELLGLNILGSNANFFNLGVITSEPFDQIQIIVNDILGIDVGFIRVYGAFVDTRTAVVVTGGLLCLQTVPDIAITYVNREVIGDLSINDNLPKNALIFGTPTALTGNPDMSSVPTINPDGTYSFITTQSGVYTFDVPVCLSSLNTECKTERLTITVSDPTSATNVPVINNDFASVKGANVSPGSVSINVLANDAAGNIGGQLGMPTIAVAPSNGSVSINANNEIVYTPNAGYYGEDEFLYQVCESPNAVNNCKTASVLVFVSSEDAPNTVFAVDDYVTVPVDKTLTQLASNGVLVNDLDPENDHISAVPQTHTVPGKGVFTLAADGSYTFVPEPNFIGAVQFEYEVYDSGTPMAKSKSSLHILVERMPDLMPSIYLPDNAFVTNETKQVVVYLEEIKGAVTAKGEVAFSVMAPIGYTFETYNSNLVSHIATGGTVRTVSNANFEVLYSSPDQIILKAKSGFAIPAYSVTYIGLGLTHNNATNGEAVLTISIFPDTQNLYDNVNTNNDYSRTILK